MTETGIVVNGKGSLGPLSVNFGSETGPISNYRRAFLQWAKTRSEFPATGQNELGKAFKDGPKYFSLVAQPQDGTKIVELVSEIFDSTLDKNAAPVYIKNAEAAFASLVNSHIDRIEKICEELQGSQPDKTCDFQQWVNLFKGANGLSDESKVANAILEALRSDESEDRRFGVFALSQCADRIDVGPLAHAYSESFRDRFDEVDPSIVAYLYFRFGLRPSDRFLDEWRTSHDDHKLVLSHLIQGELIADPVTRDLERTLIAISFGNVPVDYSATEFFEMFPINSVAFRYPKIVERIPPSIEFQDGSVWKITIPDSPQELITNGASMKNCSGGFDYIDDIAQGECVVLIIEPSKPESSIPLEEQTVNAEYNLVNKTWYPIQVQPFNDGRTGKRVPDNLRAFLDRPLGEIVQEQGLHL